MDKNTQKLENKVLTFGNTQINSCNLKGMTEKEFMEIYESKISTGAKNALKECRKYLKKSK